MKENNKLLSVGVLRRYSLSAPPPDFGRSKMVADDPMPVNRQQGLTPLLSIAHGRDDPGGV